MCVVCDMCGIFAAEQSCSGTLLFFSLDRFGSLDRERKVAKLL